jgi:hypothetical protein
MIWLILQVVIVIWETGIRYNVTSSHPWKRVRGYWMAIFAQILWLPIFLHKELYLLIPLLFIDGYLWRRGIIRGKGLRWWRLK